MSGRQPSKEDEENRRRLQRKRSRQRRRIEKMNEEGRCIICHSGTELGKLFSACGCQGNLGRYHFACMKGWITSTADTPCRICKAHLRCRKMRAYVRVLSFWKRLSIVLFRPQEEDLEVDIIPFLLAFHLILLPLHITLRDTMKSWPAIYAQVIFFVLACTMSVSIPMSKLSLPHRMIRFGAHVYDGVNYPGTTLDLTRRQQELRREQEEDQELFFVQNQEFLPEA